MTTYLFIGLILLLAAYLVRQRRARSGDDATTGPSRQHPPLRPPRKGRAPAPEPAMARAETAAAAPMSRGPLTPASREPLTTPRPAGPPPADAILDWTPAETIVEPGWPLPGEIAGGWAAPPSVPLETTPFPDGAAAPVAVLEWEPAPQADAPAAPADAPVPDAEADLPSAEEWAMPPFDAPSTGDAPAGPPLWVPGEAEVEIPPSSPGELDQALWSDAPSSGAVASEQSAAAVSAPAPLDEPPAISWGPSDALSDPAPATGDDTLATAGLVWADEAPAPVADDVAPSVWETSAVEAFTPETPAPAAAAPLTPEGSPAEAPVASSEAPVADEQVAEEPGAADPVPAVAWEMPAEAEEIIPSFEPIAPVVPAEAPASIVADFGPLTPAPVWPPESVSSRPEPVVVPASDPHPAPAAGGSTPLEGAIPLTRVCDRLGVTPRMLVLMRMLAETPRSVSEQARELGVSRPLVADLCTRLENAGLARREPVATDRRRVHIVLTDAGHRLCEETAGTPGADSLETIVERLPAADRARLLSRLSAADDTTA